MDDGNSPYDPELGDWQTLITVFSPTEGLLLRGLLQAAGVPAAVADVHLVQTHSLLAPAIPVRVQVPERRLARGQEVLAAFERGEYGLDEATFQDPLNGPRHGGDTG
ncbi:MAG TPA: DUF2007 domain-containing protein [Hydrogenophaga sp.]|uniref:putative signal transducing protein n=1 Tax=Hydrogenophaga sp. TaxID=1904254 RepID=UPI002D0ACEB7|nr:DUF2007 domain-containing protein [Hydrogenophaga sp.]HMN91956.1 DUF2007 domain-containing protein [Hydrogenophaga sp.]HMP08758.1 DUF2007 domain-containing protein [Hydrogenophaga sp.]